MSYYLKGFASSAARYAAVGISSLAHHIKGTIVDPTAPSSATSVSQAASLTESHVAVKQNYYEGVDARVYELAAQKFGAVTLEHLGRLLSAANFYAGQYIRSTSLAKVGTLKDFVSSHFYEKGLNILSWASQKIRDKLPDPHPALTPPVSSEHQKGVADSADTDLEPQTAPKSPRSSKSAPIMDKKRSEEVLRLPLTPDSTRKHRASFELDPKNTTKTSPRSPREPLPSFAFLDLKSTSALPASAPNRPLSAESLPQLSDEQEHSVARQTRARLVADLLSTARALMEEFASCVERIEEKGRLPLPLTQNAFDELKSEIFKTQPALVIGIKDGKLDAEGFYSNLAEKVARLLHEELQTSNTSAGMLPALVGMLPAQPVIARLVKMALLAMHEKLANPLFLKDLISDPALTKVCSILDEIYSVFLKDLEIEKSFSASSVQANRDWGITVMRAIQVLNPKVFGLKLFSLYRWIAKKELATGDDKVSVILSELIDENLAEMMSPSTDQWIAGLIQLLSVKLLNQHGLFDPKPDYISQEAWDREIQKIIKEKSLDLVAAEASFKARLEGDAQLRQTYLEEYKKNVQAKFGNACRKFGSCIIRAALVFEQFLKTARQAAADPARKWYTRWPLWFVGKVLVIPPFSWVFEIIHRLLIAFRSYLAIKMGNRLGKELEHRLDIFLSTPFTEIFTMKMVEKTLEFFELAKKQQTPVLDSSLFES